MNTMHGLAMQREIMKKKTRVRYLVSLLISEAAAKAKLNLFTIDHKAMIQRLFNSIWTKVMDFQIEVSTETAEGFIKVVLIDLKELLGNEHSILETMMSEDCHDEMVIVDCFAKNLLCPRHSYFLKRIQLCVKRHWPCLLAAGVITARLWFYRPESCVIDINLNKSW
ncbi:hypothetical protein Q5P01_010764 [Channa striata]|uniref:Uncharacterized protein n=1 Tax=Channa striata TaxID=64152 RepID=A0AA88SM72_CHASR|nr:hypothetical protein Q5P01_010764 [Channa striata]